MSALVRQFRAESGSYTPNGYTRTIADALSERLSVARFGKLGVGNDDAVIQAAIDEAEGIAASAFEGTVVGVYLPPGVYNVDALTVAESGVALYSDVGRGAVLRRSSNSAGTLLTVGDPTYAKQVYHVGLANVTLYADAAIADRVDTVGIALHDAIGCLLDSLLLNNFAVSVDGYRFNTSTVRNVQLRQHNRTSATQALAGIRLRGRSTDGKTSGGNHVQNLEILGSAVTENAVYNAGLEIASADGLYCSNAHIYKANYCVMANPDGTKQGNKVEGLLFSNVYLDEPSVACVGLLGQTADLTGSGGDAGFYQNIHFDNCYLRGSAQTDSGTANVDYLVRAQVNSVSANGFRNVKFTGGTYRQSGLQPFYFSGDSGGHVDVQGLVIDAITTSENNKDNAATYALFSGEVASISITGNMLEPNANPTAKIAQVVASAGQSVVIEGNNAARCNVTDPDPFVITANEGILARIADNKLPGSGRRVSQVYSAQTTDATPVVLFAFDVPSYSLGRIVVNVLMKNETGTRARDIVFNGLFRDFSTGAQWVGADPETERDVSVNPSTTSVALSFSGNQLQVVATGLAAETLNWSASVDLMAD